MFFSASMPRTVGIARTKDLDGPWPIDPAPILPRAEQIENASLKEARGALVHDDFRRARRLQTWGERLQCRTASTTIRSVSGR